MPTCSPTTCSSSATSCPGLIDFYFACNDFLAYDLAVCLNAWCFERDGAFNVTKAQRAGARLSSRTASSGRPRCAALPLLARGAALRFLLTRLYDWLNHPPGALRAAEGSAANIARKLRFHRQCKRAAAYGI